MRIRTELGQLEGSNSNHLVLTIGIYWWRVGDSNPRPLPCEGSALPTELTPRTVNSN